MGISDDVKFDVAVVDKAILFLCNDRSPTLARQAHFAQLVDGNGAGSGRV